MGIKNEALKEEHINVFDLCVTLDDRVLVLLCAALLQRGNRFENDPMLWLFYLCVCVCFFYCINWIIESNCA